MTNKLNNRLLKILIQKASDEISMYPDLRIGQAYFNSLCDINPDLAFEVTCNKNVDPFFDNSNLQKFFEFICEDEVKENIKENIIKE